MGPQCLCPDVIIFMFSMLVLSNISAAFDLYLDLTINIVLFGFRKYPYFGPTAKRSFHQLRNFDNLPALIKSSAKAIILVSLSG